MKKIIKSKKCGPFLYQRVGDVSSMSVFGKVIYVRSSRCFYVLGIVINLGWTQRLDKNAAKNDTHT